MVYGHFLPSVCKIYKLLVDNPSLANLDIPLNIREARRFFDNKVNITQAIQHNWTVRGKYKVRNLNYKKLIGMLDL